MLPVCLLCLIPLTKIRRYYTWELQLTIYQPTLKGADLLSSCYYDLDDDTILLLRLQIRQSLRCMPWSIYMPFTDTSSKPESEKLFLYTNIPSSEGSFTYQVSDLGVC